MAASITEDLHTSAEDDDQVARQSFVCGAPDCAGEERKLFLQSGTPSKVPREMRRAKSHETLQPSVDCFGRAPKCFGRLGVMAAILLAFPSLIFLTLSRNPAYPDNDKVVSEPNGNGPLQAHPLAHPEGDAGLPGIVLPHEQPTPEKTGGTKTLTEKATSVVAELVTGGTPHSVYEFKSKSIDGKGLSLSNFKGSVAVVVNVASKCGFTDVHYRELEQLYKKYKDRGFTVLAFPSNQFGQQEPGTPAEIKKFASETKGASFPLFEKIDVNGEDADPLFVFLKGKFGMKEVPWNFQKFLIDRSGQPYHQYPPQIDPMALEADIVKLLATSVAA